MEFSLMSVFAVVLVTLVTYWIYRRWNIQSRLPPSPPGAHWLWGHQFDDRTAPEQFRQWHKELGDIYTLNVFGTNIIMLGGETGIYQALVTKNASFSGRPHMFRVDAVNNFQESVIFGNDTSHWFDMKRAMINCLKMYGENLKHLEAVALKSIENFIQNIQDKNGELFDPDEELFKLLIEIMGQLVCSRSPTAEEVKLITHVLNEEDILFNPSAEGRELESFPFLKHFGNKTWKRIHKLTQVKFPLFKSLIQKRKEGFDIQDPQCLIDALLKHQTREKHPNGEPILSDMDIQMITDEAIAAGVVTTQCATYSLIAMMTGYPEMQKDLQKEVDDIIGARQPRFSDRPNMPYTEAVILETLRYTSEHPLLVPHKTTKEETIEGYLIPKGTQLWLNVYNLHHDERYWTDPWSFVPERFLDGDGKLVPADHPNRKRLMPFGAGGRHCPGEALAKNRLFLFVASSMQHFTFTAGEGEEKPINDPAQRVPGLATKTPAYKVRAQPRGE